MSVIRIALKWLIGLLCGYVITTAGVTQAHHIRHQSEGCTVMIYSLFLEKVLHSHNDNSTWGFICLVSIGMACPGPCIKSAVSMYFSVVYLREDHSHFNICTAKRGKCLILVGVHCKFLWSCHFLNYGKKHWFGEFIVWVAEEFMDVSRS